MLRSAGLMFLAFTGTVTAQERAGQDEAAFVEQAGPAGQEVPSPVYWPERIPREQDDVTRAAQAQQVPGNEGGASPTQLTARSDRQPVAQLSTRDSSDPLAQLSEAERQVLLEAIEGTDICARVTNVAAIADLCAARLETRSAEFRPRVINPLSPEERLLGEGLGDNRAATLERVIARLGRASPSAQDFDNQAIAAAALGRTGMSDPLNPAEEPGAGNLSPETRALIEAIVNQVPDAGGRP